MSRDRKRERVHRAVVKARIDQTAYEQSPLGTLERKKAEYDAHNDALRFWLGRYLEEVLPDPGQPPDTMLGSKIGLKKGAGVSEPLLFARITKAVPLDDGSLEVHGIASSEDRDDQNEVVKAEAIRAALPDYLQFPAVRMQHRADMPIGTTLEVDVGQDKVTRVVTKIVDRDAITKVRAGVLRGFSLGGSVTQRDPGDPTVITGLRLLELSLCDRPANPTAKVTLFKADMPEPVPSWHCGEHSHHQTQVEAALCRVRRELGKNGGAGVSSFEEFRCGYHALRQPLPHLMEKSAVSSPAMQQRTAQALGKRWPGVPADEIGKFVAAYEIAKRRPAAVGDDVMVGFLRHGRR